MDKFRQLSPELCPLIDVIHFCSLYLPFCRFSSNFVCELILERFVLGLQMDKFRHLIDGSWPLIDVQNCILLNIF